MLTETEVLRYIERRLGYKFMDLEIDPKEIIETIQMETLPTFSKFFPYIVNVYVNDLDKVTGYTNRWHMKTPNDVEIININRVVGLDLINDVSLNTGNDGMMFGTPRAGTATMGNPIDNQAMADIYSLQRNPTLYHFYHPDIIEISPNYTSMQTYQVILNCVHDKSFTTIPVNMREWFLKLALIDAADTILPLRNRFQSIQTTYGSIELLVDQLQELSGQRDELMDKFMQNINRQSNRKKIWFG